MVFIVEYKMEINDFHVYYNLNFLNSQSTIISNCQIKQLLKNSIRCSSRNLLIKRSNNKTYFKDLMKPKNLTQKIIYLVQTPSNQFFCPSSLELFNLYKRFTQNTIIELGEDWRIESGLLAQQIIAEKGFPSDQFCIFNQFMAGFLRQRLGSEGIETDYENKSIISEFQGQEEFLRYFNKNINSQTFSNNQVKTATDGKQSLVADFSNNLTFKTLSLGFYITAGDVWSKTFKRYHKQSIEQKLDKITIGSENKLNYFATLDTANQKWIIELQQQISSILGPYAHKLQSSQSQMAESLSKAIRLGSVVVNVSESVIKDPKSCSVINVRVFSLSKQFYLSIFAIWLIFSIKKSFNSSLFPSVCFVRYCDIIIGSKIFAKSQSDFTSFHAIYKQFKLLCDDQWKNLMKDYMIALNDDKEVLKILINRIQSKISSRFSKEIQGKKTKLVV